MVRAVGNLTTHFGRANELLRQQERSLLDEDAAVENKKDLRRDIRRDLGDVARFADATALRQPESAVRFRLAGRTASDRSFVTTSRVTIATAREHREVLTTYGMPEDLLETLTQALDRFEALAARKATSATSHVGASAELVAVTREVMKECRRIDALYRRRFRDNPELLAAWNSARNIPWKARPAKGGNGGVRPAA